MLRTSGPRSASTRPTATPRMGVMSGATIIAPMTVAVESATRPAVAMTAARTRSPQNLVDERLRGEASMKTAVVMRSTSVSVIVAMSSSPGHRGDLAAAHLGGSPVSATISHP